jgi:hypothetical protein
LFIGSSQDFSWRGRRRLDDPFAGQGIQGFLRISELFAVDLVIVGADRFAGVADASGAMIGSRRD